MKKGLMLILLLLLSVSLAQALSIGDEWRMKGQNGVNANKGTLSLAGGSLSQYYNFSGTAQTGIFFDTDGDGLSEFINIESGLLATRERSGNEWLAVSYVNSFGMISRPFVLEKGSEYYLLGWNATHLLVYNVTGMYPSFVTSKYFGETASETVGYFVSGTPTFSRPSVACSSNSLGGRDDYQCLAILNSSNYVLFNVSDIGSITNRSRSDVRLLGVANTKPALIDYYGVEVFLTYCNESAKFGLAYIDSADGSFLLNNCSITASYPLGEPRVAFGSNPYYIAYTTGGSYHLNYLNWLLINWSGFPITTGAFNGVVGMQMLGTKFFVFYSDGANRYAMASYHSANGSASTTSTSTYGTFGVWGTSTNQVTSGADDIYVGLQAYDTSINAWRYPIGGLNYNGFGETISSADGERVLMLSTGDNIFLGFTAGPLEYPNITLYLKENSSSAGVQASFRVLNSSNGFLRWPGGTNETGYSTFELGAIGLGQQHNISVSTSGYFPVMYNFTLANGSYQLNITLNVNTSELFDCGGVFRDEFTGADIPGVTYEVWWSNASNGGAYVTMASGITPDGYVSFRGPAGVYYWSGFKADYQTEILTDRSCSETIYMRPLSASWGSIPVVTMVQSYAVRTTNDLDAGTSRDGVVAGETYFCINETIFLNVTTLKGDEEAYRFIVFENDSGASEEQDYYVGSAEGVSHTLAFAGFSTAGVQSIDIWAQSDSYRYTHDDFLNLLAEDLAVRHNVTIRSSCVADSHGVVTENRSVSNLGQLSQGHMIDRIRARFDSWGYDTNLLIFFIVWLVMGGFLGSLIIDATKDSRGYLYGFGIIGFFDIAFYSFIYPILGGFVLFSVVLIVIFYFTIRARSSFSDGGGR